jgi:type IV pilus assembly protein PilA
MLQRFHEMKERREGGFTLIELLVVILIIAILAAIAIPVFLNQREKGYVADVQSTLKNGATAAESFATGTGGDYTTMTWALLQSQEGAKAPATQTVTATGDTDEFCITVTESRLAAGHPWRVATYDSSNGAPAQADTCTTTP